MLIGLNGSGKSTVLEVLAFLSTMASGGLSVAAYQARGGPDDFFRAGAGRVRLKVRLASGPGLPTEADGGPVEYEVQLVRARAFVLVEKESIAVYKRGLDQQPLYVVNRDPKQCKLRNVSTGEWDETPVDDQQLRDLGIRLNAPKPAG